MTTHSEIYRRLLAGVSSNCPQFDTNIHSSVVNGIIGGLAGRFYDLHLLVDQLERDLMPNSAVDKYLERFAKYEGMERTPAKPAEGFVYFKFEGAFSLPKNTRLVNPITGLFYVTLDDLSEEAPQAATEWTFNRSGYSVSFFYPNHLLSNNSLINIDSGTYAGDHIITVIDANNIKFTVNSLNYPLTVTEFVEIVKLGIAVNTRAVVPGSAYNLKSGASLELETPDPAVTGIFVTYTGLLGGKDKESDDELRVRLYNKRKKPASLFDKETVESFINLNNDDITRLKVKESFPADDNSRILAIRDVDPSFKDFTDIQNKLEDILPVHIRESQAQIIPPNYITVNFTFTSLYPNNLDVQGSITNEISAYIRSEIPFEQVKTDSDFKRIISQAKDLIRFNVSISYTPEAGKSLSDPMSCYILGTINFP